jgi:transcriptional regulator with XRE-family HTH domain
MVILRTNLKAIVERAANPVDLHVGARIRMRRKTMGLSQERLAESLSLTFQQVQKYERGANRVSASKLYEIARSLRSPINYFFDGLADTVDPLPEGVADQDASAFVHELVMTPEGMERLYSPASPSVGENWCWTSPECSPKRTSNWTRPARFQTPPSY